jgi:hypothetical protein
MRFFFMHLGSLVGVIVYFTFCERAAYSPDGVQFALWIALAVHIAYMALAASRGELKQFDYGLLLMFGVGALGAQAGIGPILRLFQQYSAAILFFTFGMTALVPLLLGREPFTYYYGRRQSPRWQQRLPEFPAINRAMTGFWVLVFFAAAAACVWSPRDPLFTFVIPNLLVFVVGLPARHWLPGLYLRFFPPAPLQSIEPLIMGMPYVFDRRAAREVKASIQFRVSGPEAGDYYLRIARGRCESFEGITPAPDLTVFTPDGVWTRIARGELDGGAALMQGLYRAEGDLMVLAKLREWFKRPN